MSVVAALALAACGVERRSTAGAGVSVESILAEAAIAEDPFASAADLDLARRIQHGIAANESMSLPARKVEVTVRDGVVTLRGAVANEAEKASIEAVAWRAGAPRVESELRFDARIAAAE